MRTIALASLAVLLALPLTAAQNAADFAGYDYPVSIEDPEGDHLGISGTPNAANPENDLRFFEVTDDRTRLVIRIVMATMDFGTPQGTVTVTVELSGPGDGDWEATVVYEDGGQNAAVADYDPADGTGDPDVLLPGVAVEIVPDDATIYVYASKSAANLVLGSQVTFDAVQSGRGAGTQGLGVTQPDRDGVDSVAGTDYMMQLGYLAAPPATNQTGNQTSPPPGDDSPGLGALALLAGGALAVVAARRRR